MNIDDIFTWILKHPQNYPGKHQESQPRTVPSYKPLEPKAQFHIVLKATAEYIQEKMQNGNGVNLKEFGAFTFEVISETVKPAQLSNFQVTKDLDEQRQDRKHVHRIRPCFVPDQQFKYFLSRYPGKEEITAPKSQHSIYQQGFGMNFCNPGPIAEACNLGKDLVQSIEHSFIKAVQDLTRIGHDITINFGFIRICINNKNLHFNYNKNFIAQLNMTAFEQKMRKSDLGTSQHWQTTYQDKWAKSSQKQQLFILKSLNTLFQRPNAEKVQENFEKTMALKIMSLDLNSAEKTNYSKIAVKLPQLQKK